jgi:omega-6 fatty acid desaturase (delta-12 desaturase)
MSSDETSYAHLKPRDSLGFVYLCLAVGLTSVSLGLSVSHNVGWWLAGQILLCFAFLQWFALLHEAGHKTLFRSARLNKISGHLAGFMALIPFDCWKCVHARHHFWTGWQDLDATTATLVPRKLSGLERFLINVCWWSWIPLFSVLYRLNNYWLLPRLFRYFPAAPMKWRLGLNVLIYLLGYVTLAWIVGPLRLVQWTGLGLLFTLMLQDPLILSQHTHIPMQLSQGVDVSPFSPREQEAFTRSLVFPGWFSRWILVNLDAHELHHMHASVPGYYLHTLHGQTKNSIPWWRWLLLAKRVRADVLLFQNRNQTGYDF